MANKITVTINGSDYTFMSDDAPEYMKKVAALVDERMSDITSTGRVNRVDAAVLVATNLDDELIKQQGVAENLRRQVKNYLDEANKAKSELSEAKRQITKLQQRLQQQQKK